jgi:hypothetical protein
VSVQEHADITIWDGASTENKVIRDCVGCWRVSILYIPSNPDFIVLKQVQPLNVGFVVRRGVLCRGDPHAVGGDYDKCPTTKVSLGKVVGGVGEA